MVAVEKRVGIGKFPFIPGVQENAARQGKISVDVGIDVSKVGLALEYRVVHFGAVHGDPAADVRVDSEQLRKVCSLFLLGYSDLRFQLDHVRLDVSGGGIDPFVIPQGEGRISACHHQKQHNNEVKQCVRRPEDSF